MSTPRVSEQGRDWTRMTPDEFDRAVPTAPLRLDVDGGAAPIPAVPDECGTAPLFGDETPVPRPGRSDRRPAAPVDQDGLF
ncbi:hypothetical protein [Streptomyces sp. NPDC001536]|uniref:hypothetical protein n=1 Tax=Streptomyces sp. NPDC001536 TaxID=3364583 RepID=UPI0036A26BA7